jgi:hypothetical protein
VWLSSALVGCTSSTPASGVTRAHEEATPDPPAERPALRPSPGCGEPSASRGALPAALVDAPPVLADAVLAAGERVAFGDRELAVELRAPTLWLGDDPPTPAPTLVLKRGAESHTIREFGASKTRLLDGLRLQHRWSEDHRRVWVRVTDSGCSPVHEQIERPAADAPLWIWLSSRGLTSAAFGHNHSAKLSARLWQADDGPRLSLDQSVLGSRANLWAGVDLRPGAQLDLTLGPARIVVEEVLLGETPTHLGGAVGVEPRPAAHARIRYERAAPPPSPEFPTGEVDPCGAPSPNFGEPSELLRAPPTAATHLLTEEQPVSFDGVELALENEPLSATAGGSDSLGLGSPRPAEPYTRPIVHLRGLAQKRLQQLPAELRTDSSVVRVARRPGHDDKTLRVDVYRPACPESLVASMPTTPTVLWLGSNGHRQVDLADARGGRASFELRDDPGGPPRLMVATSSPSHGARSLSFALDPESQPVALDAGDAWILGNWEVRVINDPEAPEAPAWYAVAVPIVPR